MRTKLELIAENCELNMKEAINVLKIQSLDIEVELLKRENIALMLKNEKLTSKSTKEKNED